MANDAKGAAARSYFEEVLNHGSMSVADTIFAPGIQFHYPLGELSGADKVKDLPCGVPRSVP